jgi:pyruvate dehydrogenase E2 component (dihydrolipoamide acetyltransferase)
MAEIVMPRLSDTMEEGTILRWLRQDGEEIARGEELVEIETDKATMTYESDQAGVLQTTASEGDTLAVGEVIAHVAPPGAGEAQAPAAGAAQAGGGSAEPPVGSAETPVPSAAPEGNAVAAPDAAPAPAASAGSAPAPDGEADGGRVKASPLARRIASERGVDLHGISGSGPGGRIVKADVLAPSAPPPGAAAAPPGAAAPAVGAAGQAAALQDVMTAKGETSDVELSRTQQTIARRMAESKATIPDFPLQVEVDMQKCVELRTELKRLSQQRPGGEPGASAQREVPTYNDMVVKASALALREHPRANGSYRDGRLQLHSRVNVGVAVAAEDALLVPTVFDADSKALGEIARETRALAERVRAGAITPPELGGGTFTVSNLGMYGIRSFAAIINPPQAAILSVGSLEMRAVVVGGDIGGGGELAARATMALTLSCDHRILYGADAAQFLARVRELLQTPSALTL